MKFMVLREKRPPTLAEPFAAPRGGIRGRRARGRAGDGPEVLPPEAQLEVSDLTKNDIRDAARDPSVLALAPAFPTRLVEPLESTAATSDTWGVGAVGADSSPFSGAGVRVAVLDTGIHRDHPAFAGLSIFEQDFSGSGNGDVQGHGTHCAGTIFGRDVDGLRIGVAPGVGEALIGKVLGDDGRGDSEMIFRGIQWALDQGADVISMSLGFDFPGLVERLVQNFGWPAASATSYALQGYRANVRMFDELMDLAQARASGAFGRGTIVCAAAGNENIRTDDPAMEIAVSLPAAAEGVVSVGALQQGANGLVVANFSNTFPQLSAPGVDVVSARTGGGLLSLSGTSMATPHVAGVAALWWQSVLELFERPRPEMVLANLLTSATREGVDPEVDPADLGVGMARAPQ